MKGFLKAAKIVLIVLGVLIFGIVGLFKGMTYLDSRQHIKDDLKLVFGNWQGASVRKVNYTLGFGGSATSAIVRFSEPHDAKIPVENCSEWCHQPPQGAFKQTGYGSCGGVFKADSDFEYGQFSSPHPNFKAGYFLRNPQKTVYCIFSATW